MLVLAEDARFLLDYIKEQTPFLLCKGCLIKQLQSKILVLGFICFTEETIIFFIKSKDKIEDYPLSYVKEITIEKHWFKSDITIKIEPQNIIKCNTYDTNENFVIIKINSISNKMLDKIHKLIKKQTEKRKNFLDNMKGRGLISYGVLEEKWGTKDEVEDWIYSYLKQRGFVYKNKKWLTRLEYEVLIEKNEDIIKRKKGLYKNFFNGKKNWIKIDDFIDNLTPKKFEEFIAFFFKNMNYNVRNTPYTRDFGVDIVAEKNNERIAIQVKKYSITNKVGAQEIQKSLGAIFKIKADKAILITTSDFTNAAYEQAENGPIELWNRRVIKEKILNNLPTYVRDDFSLAPYLDDVQYEWNKIYHKIKEITEPFIYKRITYEIIENNNEGFFSLKSPLFETPVVEKAIEYYIEKNISNEQKTLLRKMLNLILNSELNALKYLYPWFFQ